MGFLIRRKTKRLWDGGSSVDFCAGGNPEAFWNNRKAAKVFEDEKEAETYIKANLKAWPPETGEEVYYDKIKLNEKQMKTQKETQNQPQYIKGRPSKWRRNIKGKSK